MNLFSIFSRFFQKKTARVSSTKNQQIKMGSSVSQLNAELVISSKKGDLEAVNRLLKDTRLDPSTYNNEAIIMASSNGHIKVVDRLLEDSRVDPSAQGNYALLSALRNKHIKIVDRLLKDTRVNAKASTNQMDF